MQFWHKGFEPSESKDSVMPSDDEAGMGMSSELVQDAEAIENWKMRVQAEAARYWLVLRRQNCNPTRHAIKDDLAKWCRTNGILTRSGVNPSADYIYRHVIGKRDWQPPSDSAS